MAGPIRRFSGFSVRQTAYAAASALRPHSHLEAVLSWAVVGGTEVSCRRSTEWCEPGSLLYLDAGQTHANFYPRAAVRLHVEIGPVLWQRLAESIHPPSGRVRHALARQLGQIMHAAFADPDKLAEFTLLSALLDAIGLLSAPRLARESAPPRWLVQLREFLDAHCADKLEIDRLAAVAGRHPVHVSREFRRHFGKSMSGFVRERRLVRAAALLRNGSLPLSEIALQCGYCDQSHFTRAFRRLSAAAPGEYRAGLTLPTAPAGAAPTS